MSATTGISWTDSTWTPLRARRLDNGATGTHCERISPGCEHCYAARHNGRGLPGGGTRLDYTRQSRDRVEMFLDARMLTQPFRWKRPRRIFVCSLTDLFGEWVADRDILAMFAVMGSAAAHTFQVLTKRPERMRAFIGWAGVQAARDALVKVGGPMVHGEWEWPPRNVWLGVTAEDQQRADARIPHLLATPAAVRFVSYEPALGPVDFRNCISGACVEGCGEPVWRRNGYETCGCTESPEPIDCSSGFPNDLDWIIVGGESGPGARPCDVAWIRSVVEQCSGGGTAVFVKQLGSRPVHYPKREHVVEGGALDGLTFTSQTVYDPDVPPAPILLRDRKGGDPSEWPADLRVREFPEAVCA